MMVFGPSGATMSRGSTREAQGLMSNSNKASRRDDLLEDVKYGRMTPGEAEAEAVRLGVGKLASKPDGSQFDPMREPWWTLPMAVAWIAWRSPDKVRECWDPYRAECLEWHPKRWRVGLDGPIHAGFILEQRRPATLSRLWFVEKNEASLPKEAINISEAKAKLWNALGENAFQATGISTDTGKRVVIPDYAWPDLKNIEERGRDVLRVREASGMWSNRGYNDVTLRRQDIMAICQPRRLEAITNDLPTIRHTGPPGRPSSMHLVEAEYRARWDRGEAETSIGAEAKKLAEWFQKKHPDAPKLTPKTIANRLRDEHRNRMAQPRN